MSTPTTSINLPTAAVHAVQSGSRTFAQELAILDAIRSAAAVGAPITPGTVFLDKSGDLWLTNEEGLLGLVCNPQDASLATVHFDTPYQEATASWDLKVIYDPAALPEVSV